MIDLLVFNANFSNLIFQLQNVYRGVNYNETTTTADT